MSRIIRAVALAGLVASVSVVLGPVTLAAAGCSLQDESYVCSGSKYTDWVAGLKGFITRMKAVYPYTEWRGIDWDALQTKYTTIFQTAADNEDSAAYIRAWKDLFVELRDGHMEVYFDDENEECDNDPTEAAMKKDIGAGFGVLFAKDDEGKVRVVYIREGQDVGSLALWDEVTEVDATPVADALSKVSIRWADNIPATAQAIDTTRLRFMSRGADGATMELTTPNGKVSLTATTADTVTLKGSMPYAMSPLPKSCTSYKTLAAVAEKGDETCRKDTCAAAGYLQVGSFDGCAGLDGIVKKAIAQFKADGVSSVIVDLRSNGGGDDSNVPTLLSYFYDKEYQYEQTALLKALVDEMGEDPLLEANGYGVTSKYKIKPAPAADRWTGKVIVLVNRMVISNGDMASFCFSRIPGTEVVGFEGSSGSVSMAGGTVTLPCIGVSHTLAQSWNPDNKVQLEANKDLKGGVEPTRPVPRTEDNLLAHTAWQVSEKTGKPHPEGSSMHKSSYDVELAFARSLVAAGSGSGSGSGGSKPAVKPVADSDGEGEGEGEDNGDGDGDDDAAPAPAPAPASEDDSEDADVAERTGVPCLVAALLGIALWLQQQ